MPHSGRVCRCMEEKLSCTRNKKLKTRTWKEKYNIYIQFKIGKRKEETPAVIDRMNIPREHERPVSKWHHIYMGDRIRKGKKLEKLVVKGNNFHDRKGKQEWLKFHPFSFLLSTNTKNKVGVNVQNNLFPTGPPLKHQVNIMIYIFVLKRIDTLKLSIKPPPPPHLLMTPLA
jgi:hypothetical protein